MADLIIYNKIGKCIFHKELKNEFLMQFDTFFGKTLTIKVDYSDAFPMLLFFRHYYCKF